MLSSPRLVLPSRCTGRSLDPWLFSMPSASASPSALSCEKRDKIDLPFSCSCARLKKESFDNSLAINNFRTPWQNTGGVPAIHDSSARSAAQFVPISFRITSFADYYRLTPIESKLYKNHRGAGLPSTRFPLSTSSVLRRSVAQRRLATFPLPA